MLKFTLVPSEFFEESSAADYLSSVTPVEETDSIKSIELPQYKAVLVYCGDDRRAVALRKEASVLSWLAPFNKILVNVSEKGQMDLLVAMGKKLVMFNVFYVTDATTALFYIVSAMERFNLKPGLALLHILGSDAIGLSEEASRIFKGVEVVS